MVSIHTPTWGVTTEWGATYLNAMFQSTHLHEVWPITRFYNRFMICFNPHTYMRCDLIMDDDFDSSWVSIHTPTWGVTSVCSWYLLPFLVSIHTPTWGVTIGGMTQYIDFDVSIHTPTWGVTKSWQQQIGQLSVSIHTPTWGVTLIKNKKYLPNKFQSTHLHEVWPYAG